METAIEIKEPTMTGLDHIETYSIPDHEERVMDPVTVPEKISPRKETRRPSNPTTVPIFENERRTAARRSTSRDPLRLHP
jgi:hypothetical protein